MTKLLLSCLSTFFIITSLTAQEEQDKVSVSFTKNDTDYFVQIQNEKDTVKFHYRHEHSDIYDIYLDTSFCILINSDDRYFMLSAAYKSTVDGTWIVDYPLKKWLKHNTTGSVVQPTIHDLKIVDGGKVSMTYSIKGPPWALFRYYKTVEFPITQELVIARNGIYDLDLGFREADAKQDSDSSRNSPRPQVIRDGKKLFLAY
jgi:hypothetical protein